MNRHQNRSRSRDNYSNNNRNRSRNTGNDYRRRDDYDRNSNRYQSGGGRRVDQGNQMSQSRGTYNVNTGAAGYSQNMGMYGGGQTQMGGYGAYGTSTAFQQNRFAVSQQQMINPWANNMMPSSSMAGSGDEAKLAMNILNAVLSSSGSSPTGRGMSPPPNKMRRMDYREGGYDDRRRRPRSPPGRSHQNRQQSSQRFGSDRRGRDGHSSYQRNDDHRFRNSFSKSPGVSRSSRQSSVESSEFVFRKRLSFDERERENKKYKDLPLKALRCHMCEKSTFQSVAAYLAHVDSKGHSKVAKAFHEKIAATTTLLKQNARLALHKELTKAKAMGKKFTEKECRVCEGPMVYGNLKHKNILACKILHKFQKQTSCCGKDHKNRFMIEEHCLSLAHLKVKYESEEQNEDNKDGSLEESNTKDGSVEDSVEDEEEKMKRLKRDEARRKRKYGEDHTDEEEEDEEEEEENQDERQDEDADKNNEEEEEQKKNNAEQIDTNSGDKEKGEEHNSQEQMECSDVKEEGSEDESMETNQGKKIKDEENKDSCTTKENGHNDQTENDEKDEDNKEEKKEQNRNRNQNRRGGDNRSKNKNDKDEMYQGKTVKRMTMEELVEFHKISLVDDPEKLGPYDPAHPTGLNYIETHVAFHCMACIEYYPAAADDLKAHCCSKEHYDLFRCKYMKLQGVRDSPMTLKRLKNAKDNESKDGDKQTDTKEEKTKKENVAEEKEKDNKPATESEDVAGDDALYDPYEGESGDLTTMLQDKESAEEQECETLEGYEVQDEAHESEPENYEDNILDYEEDDGGEDEDKDEIKDQQETQKRNNKKNKEEKKVQDNKGEEVQDDEIEEVDDNENEVQDDETEEVQDDETEEVQDEENEEALDDENEEIEDDENEEVLDEENEEVQDDENQDYQEDDENEGGDDYQEEEEEEMEEEEEEEEEATPPAPTRRGRSKRF